VTSFREVSDEELLRLTPKEPRAFDEFYLRHESVVLGYFRRRTESADVALDLTAETFVQALSSVRRFRGGSEPAVAWLIGIARHLLLTSIRRGKVAHRARSRLRLERIVVDDYDLERIDEIGRASAAALLESLPADQAAAVKARVLDERSYDEIAHELRCSPMVARKRVSRGLATLRNLVVDEEAS
jgi:RNA polymerase sigma factor (sigma-70 family)